MTGGELAELTKRLETELILAKQYPGDRDALALAKQNLSKHRLYWRQIRDLQQYMDDEDLSEEQRATFVAQLTELQPANFPPEPRTSSKSLPKHLDDVRAMPGAREM
jgi:hypothetical protein